MNEPARKNEALTTADLAAAATDQESRRAGEQADERIAAAIKRLAELFAEERSKLEHQWGRGGDV
ncbi:MAG: hypothetical protein JWO48_2228 [Bryobacterales bacterium]|nr:hypothetical protein [Bryobacterales bacterium]